MSDYLSSFKVSGETGLVVYYDDEESLRKSAAALASVGVPTELRYSGTAFCPYWLVVGIPSFDIDRVIMPLIKSGAYVIGESQYVPYSYITIDSEIL